MRSLAGNVSDTSITSSANFLNDATRAGRILISISATFSISLISSTKSDFAIDTQKTALPFSCSCFITVNGKPSGYSISPEMTCPKQVPHEPVRQP